MLAISDNVTTRNRRVAEALRPLAVAGKNKPGIRTQRASAEFLQTLARQCLAAGADILNIDLQQRYDKPEVMEFTLKAIQEVADCQLCLSSNRADTLEAGLRTCQRPPIVNYVSLDNKRLKEILPLSARHGAEVIILTADAVAPMTVEDSLKTAAILVGAANESGIPNDRILIDPGVWHVTSEMGQRQLKTLTELLPTLSETFEPPIRTTVWIDNVSAGASRRLRPAINSTFLALLAGLGLSSAFVDILDRQIRQTLHLIKIFKSQVIYADGDLEVK